jgi:hypothetical protein
MCFTAACRLNDDDVINGGGGLARDESGPTDSSVLAPLKTGYRTATVIIFAKSVTQFTLIKVKRIESLIFLLPVKSRKVVSVVNYVMPHLTRC